MTIHDRFHPFRTLHLEFVCAMKSPRAPVPVRMRKLQVALTIAGLAATMLSGSALAQRLVSPCTGISLPRSSVFGYLNPLLGPLLGTVDTLSLGTLGLGDVYTSLASGQPLALNLLDTKGNVLSASDGCRLTGDSYSLGADAGVAIGGNTISGLGTQGGALAVAAARNAVAIGDGANTGADAPNAVAIGAGASVPNATPGAVALGAGSVAAGLVVGPYVPLGGGYAIAGAGAGANRELSIGTAGNERRISHVAAGGADTDAVNVSQLRSVATLSSNSVQYDSGARETVTLSGTTSTDGGATNGTRLQNVAQGTLSAASTDAVNGAQLAETNQNVSTNTNGLSTLNSSVTNLTASLNQGTIGLVQQQGGAPGSGVILVGGSTGGTVVDFSGTSGARVLRGVAAGSAATDAVNVSQLSAVAGTAANSVQYDSPSKASVTLGGALSSDGGLTQGTRISNVAQASLTASSTDAVNGAQLYATNANVANNTASIGVLTAGLGGGAAIDASGIVTGPSYTLTSIGTGGTTSTGSYNNVGDALGALGGSVVNLNQTVSTLTNSPALKYVQVNSTRGGASATGPDSIAIGPMASAGGAGAFAAGDGAAAGGESAVAMGRNSQAVSAGTVAVGLNAVSQGANAVALGAGAFAVNSVAVGAFAQAGGGSAVFGDNAAAFSAQKGTALGNSAHVMVSGGVALGAEAVASRAGLAGRAELFSGATVSSAQGAVSVGTAGGERQIVNVAGGTQATDAVNVRQLQAVQAGGVAYATQADGTPNYGKVTLGNGQAPQGTVISNLAPGVANADAVNVQQLNAGIANGVHQANLYTDVRLMDLQVGVQQVARRAYAGVAAAMSMESAPYVPGKLTYSAGLGMYESQSAVGVSLRRTADDGRWSVTGGVSATGAGGVAARIGFSGVF